ncbi:MFS transporter [bacterium]|nr:MFS transporter [bacterium]
MRQIKKFYLASFLKNQIYFVPILVLFFQDIGLSYLEIFWIFTIGSAFSFLIEIPTGIFADIYGNRKSIILSKFLIFVAFIVFALSFNFVTILVANLIYELGKSFRSGTETAYIYNYLDETDGAPPYTKVKINQKFYARISEALAALFGGFVAYRFGFSMAFWLASFPAFINFIQTLTWERLEISDNKTTEEKDKEKVGERENKIEFKNKKKNNLKNHYIFLKEALKELKGNSLAVRVLINIGLFSAVFVSLDKFVQPYMKMSGVDLQYFGIIYSVFLILVAFIVKIASNLEKKWGSINIMNFSSLVALLPLIVLGLGIQSLWAVPLFFLVLIIDNFRSPVANNLFHKQVSSGKRATMGSILELSKSVNKLWMLPLIGYVADVYFMDKAILSLTAFLFVGTVLVWIPKKNKAIY